MNLSDLSNPFPADDIEWRVSRASPGNSGILCFVLAYITARAIQQRLDDVCGPENWRNEEPRMIDVGKTTAFVGGISIRSNGEWVTKWDVAEPTQIEPSKGGFSGAMKRAGAQWSIGRYLYYLEEAKAEVVTDRPKGSGWNWAKLKGEGGGAYWWKTPELPAWALPKEEQGITEKELTAIKKQWVEKFAKDSKNHADLREGFSRFVTSVVGEFPNADWKCWTRDALDRCQVRIRETKEPGGISPDVPFGE